MDTPQRAYVLISKKGRGRDETVGAIWKYSLKPLIEHYLSGTDNEEREAFLQRLQNILLRGETG